MALTHNYTIGVITRTHLFDSVKDVQSDNNWFFKYQTVNADGSDATVYPNQELQPKEQYSKDTIFLDSDQDSFILASSVKDVYIDKFAIQLISENIQYTSVVKDHKCIVKIRSKTPIDIQNICFSAGDPTDSDSIILYKVSRKEGLIYDEPAGTIRNISIKKELDEYEFTFYVNKDFDVDILTEKNLYMQIWNVAGNTFVYHTSSAWKTIQSNYDINALAQLKIVFLDPDPQNRIVYDKIEGSVKVEIYNTNEDFISIVPTFRLTEDSIGVIDPTTVGYDYERGILSFYVRPIRDTGYVHVEAWLDIDNTEIATALKNSSWAEGLDGEWFGASEGRLIKFPQNVPSYLKNDNYAAFAQMTQDFMNTMYSSLSNNKHIGILEKINRINNFNNIKTIETKLLETYKDEFNITIDPNLDVYKNFLESKYVERTEESTKQILVPNTNSGDTPLTPMADSLEPYKDADWSLENQTVKTTFKNFVYQDITGDELYNFIKDIYKNIPYYNQLAGTYRGITFILDQLGLCTKLVEIWSDRNIKTNFDHDELKFREDELNAVRYIEPDGAISIIGRYYLTSRFDVDIMESGLTFERFNELSFNIVKLILSIKPIHRVLRKLTYVYVANTDLHFQYFLLDQLSLGNGTTLDDGSYGFKNHKFTYIWDLMQKYPASKTEYYKYENMDVYDETKKIIVDKLFVPFTALDAMVKKPGHDDMFNAFGEYRYDFNGEEKTFINGKYKGEVKPATFNKTVPSTGWITASKNTYNNLCNFQSKVELSKLKSLKISFLYVYMYEYYNKLRSLCYEKGTYLDDQSSDSTIWKKDASKTSNEIETFDNVKKIFYKEVEKEIDMGEGNPVKTEIVQEPHSLYKLLCNKDTDYPFPAANWKTFIFDIGTNLQIESTTNGFYLVFDEGAKSILSEVGVYPAFNEVTRIPGGPHYIPVCLLCKIENLCIPLGTDFIIQSDEEDDATATPVKPTTDETEDSIVVTVPEMELTDTTVQNTKLKFHLRAIHVGWGVAVDILVYDKETDTTSWQTVFDTRVTSTQFSNVPGVSGPQFLSSVTDKTKPKWTEDTTTYDTVIDNALFVDDTNLPLFRTYHPDHMYLGYKYSNDDKAFKNIEDIYGDGNVLSYEVQCNDALSYGQSSYNDFAFVIVLNYKDE